MSTLQRQKQILDAVHKPLVGTNCTHLKPGTILRWKVVLPVHWTVFAAIW